MPWGRTGWAFSTPTRWSSRSLLQQDRGTLRYPVGRILLYSNRGLPCWSLASPPDCRLHNPPHHRLPDGQQSYDATGTSRRRSQPPHQSTGPRNPSSPRGPRISQTPARPWRSRRAWITTRFRHSTVRQVATAARRTTPRQCYQPARGRPYSLTRLQNRWHDQRHSTPWGLSPLQSTTLWRTGEETGRSRTVRPEDPSHRRSAATNRPPFQRDPNKKPLGQPRAFLVRPHPALQDLASTRAAKKSRR